MITSHMNSPSSGSTSFSILVVDDEATMRRSLADILRLEGFRVQMAENGEEAIRCIQKETFDLILLDLKMPGVSGVEVLRFAASTAPDTLVILLTAHGSLESAIEALRLGAQDYLLKPSSTETILNSVYRALKVRTEILQNHELLSHLESAVLGLRGARETNIPKLPRPETKLIENGISVDFAQRMIWDDHSQVSLTSTECKFLKTLLENPQKIFTPQELVEKVQGYGSSKQEAPTVLRPLVSRLRQKLSKFPGSQKWIVNVRGKGYGFDLGEE